MEMTSNAAIIDLPARKAWADWAGMIASIGCAIHCAAMPLVFAWLPTLGLGWLADAGFHRWMAVICTVLAAMAFIPGWRRHSSVLPAVFGGIGLLMLTTAAFGVEESCCSSCPRGGESASAQVVECEMCTSVETDQEVSPRFELSQASLMPFVTPIGGLLLVCGHVLNHLKSCRCQGSTCCLGDGEETPL